MGIHLSKERTNLYTFKPYIFVKLLNQDEAKDKTIWKWNNTKNIDQTMVEEVYLWIILFLKFTFDKNFPLKSIFNEIE